MSDEQQHQQQRRGGAGGLGEGIRTGIGILTAFKEAIEETLQEAVNRGDLSPERAKEAMAGAAQRVQAAFEETRERIDVVPRRDFDALREEVERLRERVARLEGGAGDGGEDPGPPRIILTE
jgi:polyhydroxyalkanoate synthesis regulator phasin